MWKSENYEISGWERTEENGDYVYTTSVEPSDKDRALELWKSLPLSYYESLWELPRKVEIKKAEESEWLTIKAGSLTLIPAGYGDIRFQVGRGLSFVSLGSEPLSEDTVETEIKVIDGTLSESGKSINFVNPYSPSIEFEIVPTDPEQMKKLTRGVAYIKFSDDVYYNDLKERKVYAVVNGKNTELDFSSEISSGIYNNENSFLIPVPPGTEKLVIKMAWAAVPENYYDDYYDVPPTGAFVNKVVVCQGAVKAPGCYFETKPSLWYDTDGDGVKEYIYESRLMKAFGENRNVTLDLNPHFGSIGGFFPYGNKEVGTYKEYGYYEENALYLSRVDGVHSELIQIIDNKRGSVGTIDSDNSGGTDFHTSSYEGHYIYKINSEGKYVKMPMQLMTLEEYYKLPAKDPYVNPLDMSQMFVRDAPSSETFGDLSAVDLNGDGYLDFINASSGNYLLNTGMGSYVSESFGGKVIFRDFDGDGMQDLLVYNQKTKVVSVIFQRSGGDAVTKELMKGLACSDRIWCRDFDGDGDVDILIPFDSDNNSGQAYLVMMENRGNCTFKKHENYVEGSQKFMNCVDLNADGVYEILSRTNRDAYVCHHLNGYKVMSRPDTLLYGNGEVLPLDMDNSGIMRIVTKSRGIVTPAPEAVNTRPERPAAPNVVYDADNERLTVTWEKGKDKETASADLTYELRIGTAPGSGDLVWADANADGTRRNLMPGNSGYNLLRRFNTSAWPAGKIYVSLQVVDDCLRGSEFSEAAVFEKSAPTGFLISTADELCAVDETLSLYTGFVPAEGTSYRWELGDGELRQISPTEYEAVFHTPGEKTITLVATSADGKTSYTSKRTDIVPARLEANGYLNVTAAFDMDLDGKQEVFAGKFYEGDENGVYTDIKRLYNTSIDKPDAITDINKDGLPDFIVGTKFYINAEDKSFDTEEEELSLAKYTIGDLDNDGYPDIIYNSCIYRNSGDFVNYEKVTGSGLPSSTYYWLYHDFNGDGLTDYVTTDTKDLSFVVYENLGGMKFAECRRIKLPEECNSMPRDYIVGDFDGDNLPDISFTMASYFGGGDFNREVPVYCLE